MKNTVTEETIEKCKRLKEEGNAYFKSREFVECLRKYHEIILTLHGTDAVKNSNDMTNLLESKSNEKSLAEARNILTSVKLNMAAVYLETEKYHKCIEYCNQLLLPSISTSPNSNPSKSTSDGSSSTSDPTLIKAYFRRAKANFALRNYDKALVDVEEAKKYSPNDSSILDLHQKLLAIDKEYTKKQQQEWKRIFLQ